MIKHGENIIIDGGDEIAFFYKKETEKPIINIWFPGAYDRKKGERQYQRHSWTRSFEGSFLIFDDSTINSDNDLKIGWFQGCDNRLIEKVKKVIEEAIVFLGFEEHDIRLFGSSAGGFAALKLSEYFKKADALVINPQIYVLNYYKSHVKEMLRYSYKKNIDELSGDDISKLSYFYSPDREGRIFYFQNTYDVTHIKKHLNKFIEAYTKYEFSELYYPKDYIFDKENNFFVIYYSDPNLKHTPPDLQGTKDFFEFIY
ncbi:accessory Sec system protein Asp2 [Salinivibrio kushneri]|uniref:accessory Sec system protein Asp2 n=1 Tax=Salinivibrio kushneri TaxID=1908198 RepID=UPI0022B52243|nr:accessory Sec system protein Asp2 [Salinivibrio kushneri]WBA10854.1 hypothetical protein O4546_08435 [Salinivibrio kushneri]